MERPGWIPERGRGGDGLRLLVQSTGLIADSLDMLADALVYGLSLRAVGGWLAHQRRAARTSGWLQIGLAALVLLDGLRRAGHSSEPPGAWMFGVGIALLVAWGGRRILWEASAG